MIELENVRCNLCGSNDYQIYLHRGDLSFLTSEEYQLVRCKHCQLVYLNPRPTMKSFDSIYPSNYDQYTPSLSDEPSVIKRLTRTYGLRKRAQVILKYANKGRLLDIGCATGDYLEYLKQIGGWELFGIEPNAYASEYARKKLDLPILTGTINDAEFPDSYFDVITMWNVIEHLSDPVTALSILYRLLKPGGILVFNTPNLDSWDAKIFGKYWIGYELPRHFYIFSIETIKSLLTKTGFKPVEIRCVYGSYAMTMSSLRFYINANFPPRLGKFINRVAFSLFSQVATAPYFWFTDKLLLSTAPTIVSIKNDI